MDKTDRMRACSRHACLHHVQRNPINDTTPRERFGIDEKRNFMVSRIIKDTTAAGLIIFHDDTVGRRARKHLPRWAR